MGMGLHLCISTTESIPKHKHSTIGTTTDQEAMSTNANANVHTETSRLVGGQGNNRKDPTRMLAPLSSGFYVRELGGALPLPLLISSKFFEGSRWGPKSYQIESLPISVTLTLEMGTAMDSFKLVLHHHGSTNDLPRMETLSEEILRRTLVSVRVPPLKSVTIHGNGMSSGIPPQPYNGTDVTILVPAQSNSFVAEMIIWKN
jgi:hypothetical protein